MNPTKTARPAPTRKELEASLEAFFRMSIRKAGGSTHKQAPIDKGMPDRLVIMPGGRVYLVELKTEDGRLSPAQRLWHAKAAARGTKVVVLAGRADVTTWVKSLFLESDREAGLASKRLTAGAGRAGTR